MREYALDAQVKVFYERSDFNVLAREAFEMLRGERNRLYSSIVSAEPRGWEDCIPLQAADFMAYEGMKRVDGSLEGCEAIRKSLKSLISTDNTIVIAHFQDQNFADLMKMIERFRALGAGAWRTRASGSTGTGWRTAITPYGRRERVVQPATCARVERNAHAFHALPAAAQENAASRKKRTRTDTWKARSARTALSMLVEPAALATREPRRHRTGRNIQLNIKAAG